MNKHPIPPEGFNHIGWRWKAIDTDEWQTAYEVEKPDLGFTEEYAKKVIFEPIYSPKY